MTAPPGPTGPTGYPDLQKPQTRVAQSWRHMWTALRVDGPKKSARAMQAVRSTKAITRRRRK